jgi:hypothetical protein
MQHLKTTSVTFQNNIYNIRKQHLQHRESNIAVGRITSATFKHLDLLLEHPHETSETRNTHACNMFQNLPTARRISTPVVPPLVRLPNDVLPRVVARGGCALDPPQVAGARQPGVAHSPRPWRSGGMIRPAPHNILPACCRPWPWLGATHQGVTPQVFN